MKIITVIGTRPEAIKMAILIKRLNDNQGIDHRLCITAQHREMLDQVLDYFNITPDYDLNIMKSGQDLTDVTSRILLGLREVFETFEPDMVLVHGDTTTCLAATLQAFYQGIEVGHVEAGLRTGDLKNPFPEEANRVLVGRLASYHFSPTQINYDNLISEGVGKDKVLITGNTVIDSLQYVSSTVTGFSKLVKDDKLIYIFNDDKKIVLITGHRRENFGDGFINICEAIKRLSLHHPDVYFVYPVHLNPKVQKPVYEILADLPNVHLTEPLDYPDFIYAMKESYLILTDSGGVQEEAPGLGKPVLVMRTTTERPEALNAGTVKLVGTDTELIAQGVSAIIEDEFLYMKMSTAHNPYGDGKAVDKIINFIENRDNIINS